MGATGRTGMRGFPRTTGEGRGDDAGNPTIEPERLEGGE